MRNATSTRRLPRALRESIRLVTRDLGGMYRHAGVRVAGRYLAMTLIYCVQVFRAGSLLPADRAMPRGRYRFHPLAGGSGLVVNTSVDSGASEVFSGAREMYCRRVYLSQPGFEITHEDTVVDLGANIGLFTVMAAVYGKRVVAVEAQSGFLPFIPDNLNRNGVQDKVALHLGLVGGNSGALSKDDREASHWGDTPPPTDMAELMRRYELETIDFLKIDIEGSEYDLFGTTGARQIDLSWLARVRRIAMEVHLPYGEPRKIAAVLSEHGFQTWLITNSGRRAAFLDEPTGFLFAARSV